MGVKTVKTKNSLKIYGKPNLEINKKIVIKNYLKDHRVFMTSVIAALSFGGEWKIYDKDSINTSFPSFLKIIKNLSKLKKEKKSLKLQLTHPQQLVLGLWQKRYQNIIIFFI